MLENEFEDTVLQNLITRDDIIKNRVLILTSLFTFIMVIMYGIFKMFDTDYSRAQAILITFEGFVGIFVTFIPAIIYKLFRIKLSFLIRLIVQLFLFLSIICGEVFLLYYKLAIWDILLHMFSGAGIVLIGYAITRNLLIEYDAKKSSVYSLIIGIMLSLSCALLWEFAEFIIDEAFKTNMQKFIPENIHLFNGGNSNLPLNGTDEQIAEFFRYRQGYKYPLMDTMEDLVVCLFGITGFGFFLTFLFKRNPYVFAKSIYKVEKREQKGDI